MRKCIAFILALLCIATFFAGCSKPSAYQPAAVENVSISIRDVSAAGATVIVKDTNAEPYIYGSWYAVEQERNGEWYEVKTVINNYGFDALGYVPNENGEVEFTISWEWLYGKLPAGQYRLLKQVNGQYIAVTFTVAAT